MRSLGLKTDKGKVAGRRKKRYPKGSPENEPQQPADLESPQSTVVKGSEHPLTATSSPKFKAQPLSKKTTLDLGRSILTFPHAPSNPHPKTRPGQVFSGNRDHGQDAEGARTHDSIANAAEIPPAAVDPSTNAPSQPKRSGEGGEENRDAMVTTSDDLFVSEDEAVDSKEAKCVLRDEDGNITQLDRNQKYIKPAINMSHIDTVEAAISKIDRSLARHGKNPRHYQCHGPKWEHQYSPFYQAVMDHKDELCDRKNQLLNDQKKAEERQRAERRAKEDDTGST